MKPRLFGMEAIEEAEKWPGVELWIFEDEDELPSPPKDTGEWWNENEVTDMGCMPDVARKCISDGADPNWFTLDGAPESYEEGRRVVLDAYKKCFIECGRVEYAILDVVEKSPIHSSIASVIAERLVGEGIFEKVEKRDAEWIWNRVYTYVNEPQLTDRERIKLIKSITEGGKYISSLNNDDVLWMMNTLYSVLHSDSSTSPLSSDDIIVPSFEELTNKS